MILVCPSCIARYRVAVEALGATGRRVRCSRCGYVWHAEPPERVAEVVHDDSFERVVEVIRAEPETAAPFGIPEPGAAPTGARLPVPARSARRRRGRFLWTWVLCLLVLALCVVGYEERHSIATEWPWLAPVYEGFGIVVGEGRGAQPGRPK